jgi:hypothetical protein
VGVFVHVFEVGLVLVLMNVLRPVLVDVEVLVRHVVVVMRGVRVCVSLAAVVVFVRMRCVMGVLFAQGNLS